MRDLVFVVLSMLRGPGCISWGFILILGDLSSSTTFMTEVERHTRILANEIGGSLELYDGGLFLIKTNNTYILEHIYQSPGFHIYC